MIVGVVAAVILVIGIAAAVGGGGDNATTETATQGDDETPTTDRTTTTPRPTTTERPTTTTTEPEGPQTIGMGQTLSFTLTDYGNDKAFVDVTVASPATYTEEPIEYGSTPQNGLYLVLDVTVEVRANSTGAYFASPMEFKFVAADGTAADTTFAMGFEPELPTINLSAGQRATGKIVFDINPAQQAGAKIQINDSGDNYGQPFAYWAL